MSLFNLPTQDSIQQFQAQQAATTVPQEADGITVSKPSANLEYIGKQIFNAVDDMAKASAFFSATILDQIGLKDNSGYYYSQLEKPSPMKLPTPDQLSTAGQLIGDVSRGLLPFMLPGAGLPIGVATVGAKTGMERIDKGVDVGTATKSALASAGSAALFAGAGKLAGAGETLLGTIGRQAAANLPIGVASRALDKSILADQYPELAQQINVFGGKELGLDIALSVLFGGLTHRAAIKEVQARTGKSEVEAVRDVAKADEIISSDVRVDDAVRTQQTHEAFRESVPFEGVDAYSEHEARLNKALSDIDNITAVDVLGTGTPDVAFNPEVLPKAEAFHQAVSDAVAPLEPAPLPKAEPQTVVLKTMDESGTVTEQRMPEQTVTVKTVNEAGEVSEVQMPAEKAIKKFKDVDTLLSKILSCVKGD